MGHVPVAALLVHGLLQTCTLSLVTLRTQPVPDPLYQALCVVAQADICPAPHRVPNSITWLIHAAHHRTELKPWFLPHAPQLSLFILQFLFYVLSLLSPVHTSQFQAGSWHLSLAELLPKKWSCPRTLLDPVLRFNLQLSFSAGTCWKSLKGPDLLNHGKRMVMQRPSIKTVSPHHTITRHSSGGL